MIPRPHKSFVLHHACLCITLLSGPVFSASPSFSDSYLSYNTQPMGSPEDPLILRTFIRNLDLESAVLPNHARASNSPNYSAKTGLTSQGKDYNMLSGIPAAINVNLGPALSYSWDTTECRLLYGWANGFLDMANYWGGEKDGRRQRFNYTPYLIGQVFYKAKGTHPLRLNGHTLPDDFRYSGHIRAKGHPVFRFTAGKSTVSVTVRPGKAPQTMEVTYSSSSKKDKLDYVDPKTPFEVLANNGSSIRILIRPNTAETHHGWKQKALVITQPTADIGKQLYTQLGCVACHTQDGAAAHGPTFKGLSGKARTFEDGETVTANDDYLRESILKPSEHTVKGFPLGMMPPYQLNEKQVSSLLLFIQSLK